MYIKRLTSDSLIIGAPAKVNLFLQVLDRRADGFHNINSVFQAVSLFDRLRCSRLLEPGIELELTTDVALAIDETNLICRTYELMRQKFKLGQGLRVELEKNIPIAAGLGGGSSDAAATIAACNILFDLGLGGQEMAEIGAELGSDLPFFFTCGQAAVSGRGEIIEEISLPTDYWLLLVTPNFGISTAESYAGLRLDLTKPKHAFKLSRCTTTKELVDRISDVGNDFEHDHYLTYPMLADIRDGLLNDGAMLARLTGSGPTMFGVFSGAMEIERGNAFSQGDWQVHTVMPIARLENDRHDVGGNRGDY